MEFLRSTANQILSEVRSQIIPGDAVKKQLGNLSFGEGRLFVISFGKAAWTMANAAEELLGGRITAGLCITVKGAVQGTISGFECMEAGHPITTEAGVIATKKAEELVHGLSLEDTVLCLVSGGASALFEDPLVDLAEWQDINRQLLNSGAAIDEINTIRKRLSGVKGGKFALQCEPAKIISLILSDVISQDLSMVASGPTLPDTSNCKDAMHIIKQYHLNLSRQAISLLHQETPKKIETSSAYCIGSVDILIRIAAKACKNHGFEAVVFTEPLTGEVKDAADRVMHDALQYQNSDHSVALIYGGETTVTDPSTGKGGRNQELALSCAKRLAQCENTAVIGFGSDGIDGPTDAAGGYADGDTLNLLNKAGVSIDQVLKEHNSYPVLQKVSGLIMTGPTGTNLDDLTLVLIQKN